MDTSQWPQEILVKPMEEIVVPNGTCSKPCLERRVRPQKEQALNCPRCNSTNTKFCYYNNYSLSQPRYFCKACRRYWTDGGSLRNIPVGGGSRKNKRSSSSNSSSNSSSSSPSSKKLLDNSSQSHHNPSVPASIPSNQTEPKISDRRDLNLGFTPTNDFETISELIQVPNFDGNNKNNMGSALELLTGFTSRGGLNSFMPMPINNPNTVYSSGLTFPLPEFKPSLSFSLDGVGSNNGYINGSLLQGQESTSGRLLFPFEDLKVQVSNAATDHVEHNRPDHSAGYWNGMLGGGSW